MEVLFVNAGCNQIFLLCVCECVRGGGGLDICVGVYVSMCVYVHVFVCV